VKPPARVRTQRSTPQARFWDEVRNDRVAKTLSKDIVEAVVARHCRKPLQQVVVAKLSPEGPNPIAGPKQAEKYGASMAANMPVSAALRRQWRRVVGETARR
jgi:hypothetical protein